MARPGMAFAVAVAVAVLASGAMAGEPDSERKAELIYLLRQDCGACHGMRLKGGLGPSLLPEALAASTRDDLVSVVLDGRANTAMPPWRFMISPEEADWLVGRMIEGLDDGS